MTESSPKMYLYSNPQWNSHALRNLLEFGTEGTGMNLLEQLSPSPFDEDKISREPILLCVDIPNAPSDKEQLVKQIAAISKQLHEKSRIILFSMSGLDMDEFVHKLPSNVHTITTETDASIIISYLLNQRNSIQRL